MGRVEYEPQHIYIYSYIIYIYIYCIYTNGKNNANTSKFGGRVLLFGGVYHIHVYIYIHNYIHSIYVGSI